MNAIQYYNSDPNCLLAVSSNQQIRVVSKLERFWRCIKSLFIGHKAAFGDCEAAKVASAVRHLLQSHNYSVNQSWQCIDFLRKFEARVKKENTRTSIQETISQLAQAILLPKKEMVTKSIEHLESNREESVAHRDALGFLRKCKKEIDQGVQTPLPLWFHATPNVMNVHSILNVESIMQNHAARGYGAYVSSSDEAGQVIGYGRYTFALDDDDIRPHGGAYFVPNPENNFLNIGMNRLFGWRCPSIWVRVASNLTVQKRTVAYLSYPHEEQNDPKCVSERTSFQQRFPWVQLMNRRTSNKICEVFREVTKRTLPPHWNQLFPTPHKHLPKHFQPADNQVR